VSVFGVIFAPDPALALAQMRSALRPGGSLVIASWLGRGPVDDGGGILRSALQEATGGDGPRPQWDDPAWVADLVAGAGARDVTQHEGELPTEADSPEAWFEEQTANHPVWRWARRIIPAGRWDRVRDDSVAALAAGNEDPEAFRALMPYLVTRATA
ncbi:MAG: hypothetical protein AB7V62_17460, partial [Thermoleophilia bacterium]